MLIPEPDDLLPHLTFFGDTSSAEKDFMVAGGFTIAGNRITEVEDYIATLRDDAGIRSEFHWCSYRGGRKRKAYEALIDYGFDLVTKRKAALHIIISPFKGYDHKAKENEDRSTSVNRMYYQLCLHRLASYYGKKRAIHIRLDTGNDSADICAMRNQLCADAYKRYGTRPNCVRSIEPVCSKNVGAVQMADVVVGAVAAKQNNVQHTSPKGDLASYVLRASGRHSWSTNTTKNARFLTVWHFKGK